MSLNLNNLRKTHKVNATWPWEKKLSAVAQHLILGNLALVAASTDIPYETLRTWRQQPWWADAEREVRNNENLVLDDKLTKIVDRSLTVIQDRMDNGDYIYDVKTGQVKRKPVNMKDAAKVSVDLLTKRELLRGNATERKENITVSIKEQLDMLKAEFASMVNGKKPKTTEAIDVEFKMVQDQQSTDQVQSDDEFAESDSVAEEDETTLSGVSGEHGSDSGERAELPDLGGPQAET